MAESSPPAARQPAVVNTAITILYWGIAASAAWMLVNWLFLGKFRTAQILLNTIVYIGSMVWLVSKIDQGRNWARITLSILIILGLPLAIFGILKLFSHSSYGVAIYSLAQTGIQVAAIIMLNSHAAAPWFRRVAPSPETLSASTMIGGGT
jgi:hypothetical protein